MKRTFRWMNGSDVREYRFTDGVCDGFFTNGVETALEQGYRGKPITDWWLANLPAAGFVEVTP